MLRAGVRELHAILLTHEHNDHVAGLDDVRPFNFRQQKDMPLYGTPRVLEEIKRRFSYIFSESPYPGAPMLELHPLHKSQSFKVEGIPFLPIEAIHGSLPVLGFRTEDFTYLTDVKTIHPQELEKVMGTNILVLSALHHRQHHAHLNLQEALKLIRVIQPRQAYLLHISHQMGRHGDVSRSLPPRVALAYDGLVINC